MSPKAKEVYALASARRKTARAMAVIRKGSGRLYINGLPVEVFAPNEFVRMKILEPLWLAMDHVKDLDIFARVKGGGFMAQADALRMAIGRALVNYTKSDRLKEIFKEYDRTILKGDPRQTEPKKYGGRSARARFQKSYR
ncbi:30S ribosomal protein S9 [Candidatus Korarchaeum cryptofilum]|jgi:small subunit ribosomal protein S9|uniref:30S ribosomal protein S9 n=2 Tax=Candidatus Korarchaeum cryptofilum TaxID=498846 RepID=B1L7A4_KORCO|nr:30S ribosomal protein S9 [Candidatus Korarchaeum cryptofilum]ACB08333.1 ribosomal protein S9 [Candidatus Korarchaeum cryptofilum OPF8]RSN69128.1 30S ribosomal protein S9 [Candidatus Korarchaeum cryptofilum]